MQSGSLARLCAELPPAFPQGSRPGDNPAILSRPPEVTIALPAGRLIMYYITALTFASSITRVDGTIFRWIKQCHPCPGLTRRLQSSYPNEGHPAPNPVHPALGHRTELSRREGSSRGRSAAGSKPLEQHRLLEPVSLAAYHHRTVVLAQVGQHTSLQRRPAVGRSLPATEPRGSAQNPQKTGLPRDIFRASTPPTRRPKTPQSLECAHQTRDLTYADVRKCRANPTDSKFQLQLREHTRQLRAFSHC